MFIAIALLTTVFLWPSNLPTLRSQGDTIVVLVTPEPPKLTEEDLARDQEIIKAKYAEMIKNRVPITDIKPVDMTYTKGMTITFGGKDVKLPDDVYVSHVVDSVLCMEGMICPDTPVYVLQYIGTEDDANQISISQSTGEIYVYEPSEQKQQRFAWLYSQLETK